MHISKFFLTLFTLLILCSNVSQATSPETEKLSALNWEYVGKPDFLGNKSLGYIGLDTYSMAVNANGIPYLAILFERNHANFKLMITQYNPKTNLWDSLGNFNTYSMHNVNMAIDRAGVPYVAHVSAGKQIVVLKYDMQRQQWISLGSVASAPDVFDLGLKIAFDHAGIPYLIYGDNKQISVMKYTGKQWVPLRAFISPSGEIIGNPKMVITPSDKIYIAFVSTNYQYQSVKVMTLINKDWQPVAEKSLPSLLNYTGTLNNEPISLALDSEGNPYLAYVNFAFLQATSLLKLSGKVWKPIGKLDFTPAFTNEINLILDSHNTPYLAFTYFNNTSSAQGVMKFNGKEWVKDTSLPPFSPTDNMMRTFLKSTSDNKLYLGYARCLNKAYDDCSMNVLKRYSDS